ncbi:uncharacterized protein M437DRAFT_69434 [Aureobasidium melanogenum CBS 110374]|uniref:BTB domain-containing protein n=1 Tax=Aureobasidium melanogenum (strain CBS 110374) TaxID=1043003 RepID=A0A074VN25_AURM1|nr:uncharacterized protein M437DRAFT_69434 [Aureobasidium melanogenum CBS 110374]KEQ59077.1 hypothetical protein M437DRAFT_69434 [Aureobasidium melanogenum CBS 110374]
MRMYNDPTTSDVIIHFLGRSIYAHKAILAEHSEAFYRTFYGPFAKTSYTIPCEEYDTQAIVTLLKHIYSFPYEEPINVEVDPNWYFQLYLIAVEYWADSFETKVLDLIEAEVFLSVKIIYDRQKLKDCCRASDKYEIDKQEITEEKKRRITQRLVAENRICRDRFTCVESEEGGETNEADRVMMGLEEVLARLSMADKKQQGHEKKMRRLAHPGRLRFRTYRGNGKNPCVLFV